MLQGDGDTHTARAAHPSEAGIQLRSCFLLSTEFGMKGILSPHPVGTKKGSKTSKTIVCA